MGSGCENRGGRKAGEETRICKRDPGHIEHHEIPALATDHTVTVYFRYTGNGRGGAEYPGQIQPITKRSGTGSGDMTIQWDWDTWTEEKPFNVDGLGDSTYSTYSTADGKSVSNTVVTVTVTAGKVTEACSPLLRELGCSLGRS